MLLELVFAWACSYTQEVFTYIDRMKSDYDDFMAWLERAKTEKAAANAKVAEMRSHPWFGTFVQTVGACPNQWGNDDPLMEVEIWEEWRSCAEQQLLDTTRVEGARQQHIAKADEMANCETQIVQDSVAACTCSAKFEKAIHGTHMQFKRIECRSLRRRSKPCRRSWMGKR